MEKQSSFQSPTVEKQQSFRRGVMEKQKSFRGLMEKQKSFRIAIERQIRFGGERKMSKDSPGKLRDSPLHLAARAANKGKVKENFQKFENINNGVKYLLSKKNQEGETPLYVVAENGHASIVGEFLRHSNVDTASISANNGYDPRFH